MMLECKFRDPKTREVYSDITLAWEAFCAGLKDACPACPLTASKTGRNFTCNDFVVKYETEAARLMGYEVVEDHVGDATEMIKEEPMEKKEKPRICEVLGGEDNPLEVDEVWCVTGNDRAQYHITYDGNLEYRMPNYNGTGYGRWISTDVPTDFIAHPDRIIRKPRFTQKEVAKAAHLHGAWGENARLRRTSSNTLTLEQGEGLWLLPNEWFPSLRPGQSVSLQDILKED